ncbi:MAG: hypothetical protein ACOYMN_12510 [Roseimicrobium sp.]
MSILNWKHRTTADEARDTLRTEFERLGYGDKVQWTGHELEASVPMFLEVKGRITDDAVVLDKCAGMASSAFLGKCRDMLAKIFPEGAEA